MTMRILIVGAGGHAQVVADCLLQMAAAGHSGRPIGYVDDNLALQGQSYLQLPVLGRLDQIESIPHDALIVGIGHNPTRQRLYESFITNGERIVAAIHPRAIIAPDVVVGTGTLICAGAVVNTGTIIGHNVIINTGATVDHGNQIADHAHIAPGVHLGGDVQIGKGTLVGIGAIVMPQRTVGHSAVVGAGSLVYTSVADHMTVIGIPARVYNKY